MPPNDTVPNTLRPGDFPMDKRSRRRSLILANSFEFSLAFAGLIGAVVLLCFPSVREATSAGILGFKFGIQWAVLYFLGSAGVLYGLWKAEDRFEIVGLILLASACFVNFITLIQVKGFPSPGTYIAFQFLGFSLAAGARIYLLLRLRRVVLAVRKRS